MNDLLKALPYAQLLGLTAEGEGADACVLMPFDPKLIGNPFPPTLHGGSTAALLEITAAVTVAQAYPEAAPARPINVSIAYLRAGKAGDVRARARINKAGKRVANVLAEAWQDDPAQPIATLTAHFLLNTT